MTNTREVDWPPVIEVADKVAQELANKWRIVEKDDVKQEILEHFLREREWVAKNQDDGVLLRKAAWTAGKRYAAKERDYCDLMDDQYYYTPEEVRQALRSLVWSDDEIGQMMGRKDDLTKARITDNVITARLDAEIGMEKLSPGYRDLIQKVFIEGMAPEGANEERAAYRAVDALTRVMNRVVRVGR
ncbi:hypothetical protein [Streptomyces sp. NPDC002644]